VATNINSKVIFGVSLQAGLSAYTAQALATWPVSAAIPNAKLPFGIQYSAFDIYYF
jgi:hypothetical protein